MATIIRIKRSTGSIAPASLKTAEMAYTYGVGTTGNMGERLFIGTGDDGSSNATSITVIGGSYFTDMLDHVKGTLTANSGVIVDSDKKIDQLLSGDIVIDGATNTITTPGKILYSNVYNDLADLPSASTYHGMFAHVHATGKGYFAHAGNWVPLANNDDLDSVTSALRSDLDSATTELRSDLDSAIAGISQTFSFTGDAGSDTVTLADSSLRFQGVAGQMLAVVTDNRVQLGLQATNVAPGTYGSTTSIPTFRVDNYGRIDSAKNVTIEILDSDDSAIFSGLSIQGNSDINFRGSNYNLEVTDSIGIKAISSVKATKITLQADDIVLSGQMTLGTDINNHHLISNNMRVDGDWKSKSIGFGYLGTWFNPWGGAALQDNLYMGRSGTDGDGGTWVKPKIQLNTDKDSALSVTTWNDNSNPLMVFNTKDSSITFNVPVNFKDSAIFSGLKLEAGNIAPGEYGSPSEIPVLTFDSSGFVDSVGTVAVAGVDSASWDETTNTLNIATGDGTIHDVTINEFDDSVVIYNDKNLVFGNGYTWNGNPVPGRTTMRHDTTDHWFEIFADSHTTAMEIAAKGITLIGYDPGYDFRSGFGALSGNGYINLDGNVVPAIGRGSSLYNQGYRRDLGKSNTRFGTVYVDSVDRGHYIDSGTYGNAAAIPVFTVNKTGLIDSIGTVPVAGVDSANWGSSSLFSRPSSAVVGDNIFTITTGDGTAHEVEVSQFADSVQFGNHVRFSHQPGHKIIVPHANKISFQDHTVTSSTSYAADAWMSRMPDTLGGDFEINNINGPIEILSGDRFTLRTLNEDVYINSPLTVDDSATFNENINFGTNKNLYIPAQTYLNFNNGRARISANASSLDSGALSLSASAPMQLWATKGIYLNTYPNLNGGDSNVYVAGNILPYQHPTASPNANWNIGIDSSYTWNNAYFMGTVKAGSFQAGSFNVDNIQIDGNTISSTDSSNQIFIDPFPVGDSGDLVIRGNLIVQGTQTTVNSTIVSLNDKNLVLADSAATAAIADGAGLTVGGDQFDSTATKPQFVFDAATYRWDPNLPIDIPFVSLDSAVFLNGVALREVMEDHLDNFFGVDSNNAVTITYDDVANTMTWKGTDASTTQKGVSSFDSSNFTITAGHVAVTVLDGGTY